MIYFASDIHLGCGSVEEARTRERRFTAWLDRAAEDAEAIFLLGDLFDFWFEYRRVVPQGFVRTLGKLAALTDRGIRVVFFTGNHDMWVGDYLYRECGVEIHTSPCVMDFAGRRIFLAHGDNLNIARFSSLRLMNAVFRSRSLRWLFSWLVHPDWAVRFGRWWSGCSRKSHGAMLEAGVTDPLVEYARERQKQDPVDCYVFGHMHYARDYSEEGLRVVLLGAWDDPTYAVLDDAGRIELKRWQAADGGPAHGKFEP
ncbi:UDP-2,3-diacylglucosamine diphosphatase [uncultured Alistipes sp.]|uniref:UDP-2,3-diacylglucosamine diphosphatase n=1 Tax=uncultured Alistipes sp. TaxID=538949 RepID=UPI0026089877|nr:UDP-2,3-diacylglucosamine diphosphatase [uncultured Alistipes sp.]